MVGKDDEVWQAIVENYGERAELEPDDEPAVDQRVEPSLDDEDEDEYDEPQPVDDPDDTFVPPPAPPMPRPPNDRLLAWLGVLGTPVLVLVLVLLGLTIPGWAGLLLAASFVGGFLYLVMRSPRSPRDPWDDGARV